MGRLLFAAAPLALLAGLLASFFAREGYLGAYEQLRSLADASTQALRELAGVATTTSGRPEKSPAFPVNQNSEKLGIGKTMAEMDEQQVIMAKKYKEALEQSGGEALVTPEQPDEVRRKMPRAARNGPALRCGQDIPTNSRLETRNVELSVKAIYQGSYRASHSWKYQIKFKNYGDVTVQMLTRHWLFLDEDGDVVSEVKGPGARGVTPVLTAGAEWNYESGTQLPTSRGSMMGSFQFEVLSAEVPAEQRSFSARVARLALTTDGKSFNAPCMDEADEDLLPATGVLVTERVIAGGTVDYLRKTKGEYLFEYDVQINNAQDKGIEVVGHRWDVVDSKGKRHVIEGVGVGGVYSSESKSLPAGDAFRTQGTLRSPTKLANAEGTYFVMIDVGDGQKAEIEVRTDLMGLSADSTIKRVQNFVVDPKFR